MRGPGGARAAVLARADRRGSGDAAAATRRRSRAAGRRRSDLPPRHPARCRIHVHWHVQLTPAHLGSIRSSASSHSSPSARSGVASIAAWLSYAPRSRPSSSIIMPTQSRSGGQNLPTIFWAHSVSAPIICSPRLKMPRTFGSGHEAVFRFVGFLSALRASTPLVTGFEVWQ